MRHAMQAATLWDYLSIGALIGGTLALAACVQSMGVL